MSLFITIGLYLAAAWEIAKTYQRLRDLFVVDTDANARIASFIVALMHAWAGFAVITYIF